MTRKIAFIASYPQSLLNFRLALMQSFIARGYRVIALAPADDAVAKELATYNIDYFPVPMQRNGLNPFADAKLVAALIRILSSERPDAVFSYTIKPVIYGSIAAKLAGIKSIYSMITGTGYIFIDVDLKSKVVGLIARNLFKFALRFNSLVYFQNIDNRDFFQEMGIIAKSAPTAIINGSGVDCDAFLPVAYPEQMSFLMIARFLYDKGIREFIQAARITKAKHPQIKFQLVGWIDTNPNSITQAELDEWVHEGIVEYLGKLSDVREAIKNASVYVLPSYHEGTPRTVLEAMAMARPIITTDAAGCKETVINNKNGFLVPVKSVQELVNAIEYFIKSPEMIPVMGQMSRDLALEKYDVNKVNDSIHAAMEPTLA